MRRDIAKLSLFLLRESRSPEASDASEQVDSRKNHVSGPEESEGDIMSETSH
jgi:hypothetical protein